MRENTVFHWNPPYELVIFAQEDLRSLFEEGLSLWGRKITFSDLEILPPSLQGLHEWRLRWEVGSLECVPRWWYGNRNSFLPSRRVKWRVVRVPLSGKRNSASSDWGLFPWEEKAFLGVVLILCLIVGLCPWQPDCFKDLFSLSFCNWLMENNLSKNEAFLCSYLYFSPSLFHPCRLP